MRLLGEKFTIPTPVIVAICHSSIPNDNLHSITNEDQVEVKISYDNQGMHTLSINKAREAKRLQLCSKKILALSGNILALQALTVLKLCCNGLVELPREIGLLKNLRSLTVSKNRLESLPDTIGLLTRLEVLKADDNRIREIPTSVAGLSNLRMLILSSNQITSLPEETGYLHSLTVLNISNNESSVLPESVLNLRRLEKLYALGCAFNYTTKNTQAQPRAWLSLKEVAGRTAVRHYVSLPQTLPMSLREWLRNVKECSACRGPYFDSCVTYRKNILRDDVLLPVTYTMCKSHWETDKERVQALFATNLGSGPKHKIFKRVPVRVLFNFYHHYCHETPGPGFRKKPVYKPAGLMSLTENPLDLINPTFGSAEQNIQPPLAEEGKDWADGSCPGLPLFKAIACLNLMER